MKARLVTHGDRRKDTGEIGILNFWYLGSLK